MEMEWILNWAQRFLNLKKMCQNWNYKVFKWEEPNSNPHPKNFQFEKKKSKLGLEVLFKKKELHNNGCNQKERCIEFFNKTPNFLTHFKRCSEL